MEQLLLTLDFFQRQKVIHRDIKIENILVSEVSEPANYDIRVADFGLAVFTPHDEYLRRRCGSPGYAAPEVLLGRPYNYKADIFSAGAVFFNLLTRRYLFSGETVEDIVVKNARCEL